MNTCPYCGSLTNSIFCKGHNIAYKRRLLVRYNNGDTSVLAELERYGWMTGSCESSSHAPISYSFRKFGIELETSSASSDNVSNSLELLRAQGLNIREEGYNHRLSSHWKVVTDASLSGGYTREFVSHPFESEELAISEITRLSQVFELLGVKVNNSCGFHVHLDASDLTPRDIARAVKFYQVYESDIDELHQRTRRRNQQRYCRSLSGFNFNPDNITSVSQLRDILGTRYLKVNVEAYLRHGTLEFRQHGGTVSAIKILYWVKFCTRVIEYAKSNNPISHRIPLFEALNLSEDEKVFWKFRKQQLGGAA